MITQHVKMSQETLHKSNDDLKEIFFPHPHGRQECQPHPPQICTSLLRGKRSWEEAALSLWSIRASLQTKRSLKEGAHYVRALNQARWKEGADPHCSHRTPTMMYGWRTLFMISWVWASAGKITTEMKAGSYSGIIRVRIKPLFMLPPKA